jgi:hypothetical protein
MPALPCSYEMFLPATVASGSGVRDKRRRGDGLAAAWWCNRSRDLSTRPRYRSDSLKMTEVNGVVSHKLLDRCLRFSFSTHLPPAEDLAMYARSNRSAFCHDLLRDCKCAERHRLRVVQHRWSFFLHFQLCAEITSRAMDGEKFKTFQAAMAAGREAYRRGSYQEHWTRLRHIYAIVGVAELIIDYWRHDGRAALSHSVTFFVVLPLVAFFWCRWRYRPTS